LCSRVVATAAPNESVLAIARRMAHHEVGTLVVLEGGEFGKPLGVVTDRDITVRCTAEELDPAETPVAEVMTRRLVVTGEQGHLVGIFSLDDALELLARQASAVGQLLARQQPQIPA